MHSILSNFSNDYIEPNLFWPMFIILTIIVIVLIFMFTTPLPYPDDHIHSSMREKEYDQVWEPDHEFTIINEIENTQLDWLRVVVFLITLAVILRTLDKNIFYSIFFLIVSFVTAIVLNIDYIQNRREAAKSGYETTWRMDYLFYVVILIMVIVAFILYDIIRGNFYRPKQTKNNGSNIGGSNIVIT